MSDKEEPLKSSQLYTIEEKYTLYQSIHNIIASVWTFYK